MACLNCRHKKVRCDLMQPRCSYCKRRELLCRYESSPPEPRKRIQRSQSPLSDSRNVRARYQYPCDIQQQQHAKFIDEVRVPDRSCEVDAALQHDTPILVRSRDEASEGGAIISTQNSHQQAPQVNLPACETLGIASTASGSDTMLDDLLKPVRDNLTLPSRPRAELNASYLDSGPAAGLSLLRLSEMKFANGDGVYSSDPAFSEEVTSCRKAVTRIQQSLQELAREPVIYQPSSLMTDLTACTTPGFNISKYIDTFFDSCQATFPVVSRQSFDEAWKEHTSYTSHVNVPWSLLCYSILALGAFTRSSASFHLAREEGMKYFGTAMDLQGLLFKSRPNLMVVQAFLVLTMFAQMIGNPELVYRCSSHAVHMARYLQLQGGFARMAFGAETQEHRRVFWIVYIFDKCHSFQVGVSSAIDDTQINQPFPTDHEEQIHGYGEMAMAQLRSRAQLSSIYSAISRRLYSPASLHANPRLLLRARDDLCYSLSLWLDQVPAIFQIRQQPFRVGELPSNVKPVTVLILRVMYQNALLSIHRRFSSYFEAASSEYFDQKVVETSEQECLQAARELILLLDRIETGLDVPYWFLAYHLVVSVVLVFYSVVRNPWKDSVKDDIALIHIATGAFGRLKYCTSGHIAFAGVTELPQLAERIVDKAKTRNDEHNASTSRTYMNLARVASLDRQDPDERLACTLTAPSNMYFSPGDFTGLFDTTTLLPLGWDADELFSH